MTTHLLTFKRVAAAALLCAAGASQAAITVYTTAATFNAATANRGVDTFSDLNFTTSGTPPLANPLARTAGTVGYTAYAAGDGLFTASPAGDAALSTYTSTDFISISNFTTPVRAIGANFFGSDVLGQLASGTLNLVVTDSQGVTSSLSFASTATSTFRGFVSDANISYLVLTAVQPAGNPATPVWPSLDNLTVATAVIAVPEPETYAMLLAGMACIGMMVRRRT